MFVPVVILTALAVFWGVSLLNVLRHRGTKVRGEQDENPLSPAFSFALLGTLLLFAEAILYSYYSLTGVESPVIGGYYKPPALILTLGAATFACGALLHSWSVMVRGRYAVSWAMPEDQRLITEAPYSIARHPSYLGYILMILGMSLVWGNVVTLVPWIAIPGYYYVSVYEESMLIQRFGDEYLKYMKQVNRFIPRIGARREAR